MQTTVVETRLGPIPLSCPPGVLSSAKPLVLVITGAWAPADEMGKTAAVVAPHWDAAVMRLPGNETPPLAETSIAAWARSVDEMVDTAFAGRPVVALGLSVGALVALGLRSPGVRRIVAVEPPLDMRNLWPMARVLTERWRAEPADRPFIEAVFGVRDAELEPRTYFDLLGGSPPVDVVVGDVPLHPERPLPRFPSLVDEPTRAWLARQPNAALHVAAGAGHAVQIHAAPALRHVLMGALDAVSPA